MRFTARLLAATALVSAGLTGAAAAQDFSLKFQSSDPAGNANFLLQQEWAKDVAAKTDGRVEVDLLPVETIVAHTESQDARDGSSVWKSRGLLMATSPIPLISPAKSRRLV